MNALTSVAAAPNISRLRGFVSSFAELLASTDEERAILERGSALLRKLVAHDDWLPEAYARPDPTRYQQYLLHCDSRERFSMVSFVWGPGQATPVHDHGVWGLVGILRGAELVQPFVRNAEGDLVSGGPPALFRPGEVDAIGPGIGDVHRVANAYDDRTSISIHVYGANIGAVERATYDTAGRPKRFVSGYANRTLPNLWDGIATA
ncbi:cysteine dioxygenase [Sphingomonas oleivorans]|uniref:Cysteine dioxygenase n=1 Tax=Sphingomonas oleivorans TaxID=1735121 RepID=A0A2T5FTP7_9SPHN|nr:cysteine dioxygenase [Sphingomonas oleivorans]PTQ07426.1 cysteine dioxygenase [Sphingomonas oleivorans]